MNQEKTMFINNCELRIGRSKLNITSKQDLLYGTEYRYGIVTHWKNDDGSSKSWMWDSDFILPCTSEKQMQEWADNFNLAMKKPILELDDINSVYKKTNL